MADIEMKYVQVQNTGRALCTLADDLAAPASGLRNLGNDSGASGFRVDTACATAYAHLAELVESARASLGSLGSRVHASGAMTESTERGNAALAGESVRPGGRTQS